jgi:hypothetical protein
MASLDPVSLAIGLSLSNSEFVSYVCTRTYFDLPCAFKNKFLCGLRKGGGVLRFCGGGRYGDVSGRAPSQLSSGHCRESPLWSDGEVSVFNS